MLAFLRNCVAEQFMNDWQMQMLQVGTTPEPLLADLVQAAGLSSQPRLSQI